MTFSLKLGLLASLSLPVLCPAQQPATAPAKPAVTTDALLNSPLTAPLDQAAGFSPIGSSWNITGGYQWRQIGDLNFKTGSRAANSSLPWRAGTGRSGSSSSSTSSSSGTPATSSSSTSTTGSDSNTGTAGSATAYGDRTYDDGYVNQDGLTPGFGTTWFWGYNNASQYSGGNLSYHTTAPGATTTTTTTATGGSTATSTTTTTGYSFRSSSWSGLGGDLNWDSDLSGSGGFARIESPAIFATGSLAVSLEIGYSFTEADASSRNADVFRAHQETEQRTTTTISTSTTSTTATGGGTTTTSSTNTITDSYAVGLFAPGAGYAGTYAGPGPRIPNKPTTRTITSASTTTTFGAAPGTTSTTSTSSVINGGTVVERTTADFFSEVSESLDVNLHTISFGPHFSWECRRLRMGLSTGLALNIADWDADYREELFVSENGGRAQLLEQWQDHEGGTKVLPGFYLEANANVRLTSRVSLFAGGRYDWAGTLRGTVGPSSFDLDLGGWSVLGGVTFTF